MLLGNPINRTARALVILGICVLTVSAWARVREVKHRTELPKTTPENMKVVKAFKALDFSWIKRSLNKEPTYKSKDPRYQIYALGNGRKSVVIMVWDESKGTGTGHDTLYADLNYNGDLTDRGECLQRPLTVTGTKKGKKLYKPEKYVFPSIKEADGQKTFTFSFEICGPLRYHYRSKIRIQIPNENGKPFDYRVGLLPGAVQPGTSKDLASAPVFHIGGLAVPVIHMKERKKRIKIYPGDTILPHSIGNTMKLRMTLSHYGDKGAEWRFMGCAYPGVGDGVRVVNTWGHAKVRNTGYPLTILRILDSSGKVMKEVPGQAGCG